MVEAFPTCHVEGPGSGRVPPRGSEVPLCHQNLPRTTTNWLRDNDAIEAVAIVDDKSPYAMIPALEGRNVELAEYGAHRLLILRN